MDMSETKSLGTTHESAKLDEASKLLLKAADLIERRGWCQNHYASQDGRLCYLGALKTVLGVPLDGVSHPLIGEAGLRMSKAVGRPCVWQWNDDTGRTQEEVVSKMRAVALAWNAP